MSFSRSRHVVLSFFFVLLLTIPVYWMARGKQPGEYSIIEERSLAAFPKFSLPSFLVGMKALVLGNLQRAGTEFFNQFLDRQFQTEFEDAAADQFPLRFPGIQMVKAVERAQIRTAYSLLPDAALPADMRSGYYVMRDGSMLLAAPTLFDEGIKSAIDDGLQNYRDLLKTFPDVNFYVFYIQRLEDSSYYPLNQYFPDADGGRAIAYFEENLPEGIIIQKMLLSGYTDYVGTSFATDHHWNIRGACRGYEQIVPMLAQNSPEIPAVRACEDFVALPTVAFLGSYARETLYPISPEPFEVTTSALPPYTILLKGKEIEHTKMDNYMQGIHSREPYVNHYARVYGSLSDPIEYVFPGSPERSLLIIGSSHRAPIQPFLASHYRHTYIIDPRYDAEFSLGEFLKEHHVDDLLIIGHGSAVFGIDEWRINP